MVYPPLYPRVSVTGGSMICTLPLLCFLGVYPLVCWPDPSSAPVPFAEDVDGIWMSTALLDVWLVSSALPPLEVVLFIGVFSPSSGSDGGMIAADHPAGRWKAYFNPDQVLKRDVVLCSHTTNKSLYPLIMPHAMLLKTCTKIDRYTNSKIVYPAINLHTNLVCLWLWSGRWWVIYNHCRMTMHVTIYTQWQG